MRATPMRDLSDIEIARLQALLDEWAASAPPEAPLDASALDGYLCGVLLQPQPVAERAWWPWRPGPTGKPAVLAELTALARQRHAVLDEAIVGRRWFDPWIFDLDEPAAATPDDDNVDAAPEAIASPVSPVRESLLPWVAGFALAVERFPALLRHDERALAEPLSLLYQHFERDDLEGLEDEPALAQALAEVEPPADMAEAAEDVVRAVLLLADVSRPLARTGPAHASPGPAPRSRDGRRGPARRG